MFLGQNLNELSKDLKEYLVEWYESMIVTLTVHSDAFAEASSESLFGALVDACYEQIEGIDSLADDESLQMNFIRVFQRLVEQRVENQSSRLLMSQATLA